MTRRTFLVGAAAASQRWAGANDRIRAAVVGTGWRGMDLVHNLLRIPGAEVAAVCDVDDLRTAQAAAAVQKKSGKTPAQVADFRRILDDKTIDTVSFATPDHWHGFNTIWACQAGKHVLIEKPISHNFIEGQKMVEAARKYKRVVQGGTQRRSSGGYRKAIQLLHEGVIGDLYLARWTICVRRKSLGFLKPEPPPRNLHWDLWLGPAPEQPHHFNLVHYNWHWFWDFGGGEVANNGAHYMDVARWGLNRGLPQRVFASGGRFGYKDQGQTPNTLNVACQWDDGVELIGEVRGHLTPETNSLHFYGAKGYMHLADGGPGAHDNQKGVCQIYLNGSKTPEPDPGRLEDVDHTANFLDAVRSGKPETLTAELEQIHLSGSMCNFANISYRLKRQVRFDPKTNRFPSDAEANGMLGRTYRRPFVLPSTL